MLKLYLVSGMTLDAIGKSLGVTRQAVAKTLARARETVVGEVEAAVQQTLKISKEDLASILRVRRQPAGRQHLARAGETRGDDGDGGDAGPPPALDGAAAA